ncbi:hypothetical protein BDV3_000668 [Batrachochytrium dendrobatidis]
MVNPNKNIPAAILQTAPWLFAREWLLVTVLIFGGCCSNVYTLEMLVRSSPASGNLITFSQFAVVAIEGFISNLEFIPSESTTNEPQSRFNWKFPLRLRQRVVPLYRWMGIIALFLSVSVLNNYALGFSISMPVHIIFRSASLWVSMIMSWLMFNKSYSKNQITGAVLVTIGMVLATLKESNFLNSTNSLEASAQQSVLMVQWTIGVIILSIAIILSCFLGQLQQHVYQEYGEQWREGLFYTHALGLPAFIFLYKDLKMQALEYNASPIISIGDVAAEWLPGPLSKAIWSVMGLDALRQVFVPEMWLFLVGNVLTQYVCISGVHRLSFMTSAVTLHLILTLRKFVSLILSVLVFKNVFTTQNWVGKCFCISTIHFNPTQNPEI